MRKRSVVLYDMQYRCPLRWSRTSEWKNLITNKLMSDSEGDEKKFSIRISSYINKFSKFSHSFLAWFQTLSLSSAYIFISSLPLSLTCRIRTRGLIVIPYTTERNNKNFIRWKGFKPHPPFFQLSMMPRGSSEKLRRVLQLHWFTSLCFNVPVRE